MPAHHRRNKDVRHRARLDPGEAAALSLAESVRAVDRAEHLPQAFPWRTATLVACAIAAAILLGPSVSTVLAVGAIARIDSLHYSRAAEEQADLTGSDTCAAADYNPWGLVWLFQDFSNAQLDSPPAGVRSTR